MAKITVDIEAQPWVLETAANILQTFLDRAPTCDREGVAAIAYAMLDAVNDAPAEREAE